MADPLEVLDRLDPNAFILLLEVSSSSPGRETDIRVTYEPEDNPGEHCFPTIVLYHGFDGPERYEISVLGLIRAGQMRQMVARELRRLLEEANA